jgi:hypothetical protein
MPHLKCLACKTRLHSTESQADPTGDLCPVCGSLLEPVGDLDEIVGYHAIETRGGASHSGVSGTGQLIAERVGEIIARPELGAHESGTKPKLRRSLCQPTSPRPQLSRSRHWR